MGTELSKVSSGGSIIWAILLVLFGFLAIAAPFASSWGVIVIVSWLIVFSGAVQLVHAFQSKGVGHILWKLLVAGAYLVAGFYFLAHPLLSIAAFTLALAAFFMVEGVMDLAGYFQARRAPGAGWILFDGIVTLLLGIMVWARWPSSSLYIIGTLVGISMVFTGTTRFMLAMAVRKAHRVMAAKAGS